MILRLIVLMSHDYMLIKLSKDIANWPLNNTDQPFYVDTFYLLTDSTDYNDP